MKLEIEDGQLEDAEDDPQELRAQTRESLDRSLQQKYGRQGHFSYRDALGQNHKRELRFIDQENLDHKLEAREALSLNALN